VPFLAFDVEIRKVICTTNDGVGQRPDPQEPSASAGTFKTKISG
jgi:hypothetical protein